MNFVEKILNVFKLPENQNASDFSLQEKAIIPSGSLKKADIIYFKNGQMYKTSPPDARSWYDAKFLVSDGEKYNLESIHDLCQIPVPTFASTDIMHGYGITGSLEYVLKMKAGNLRNNGFIEESDCLYKRIHLFLAASNNCYRLKDYLYYSHILLTECKLQEYEQEKQLINDYVKNIPNKPIDLLNLHKISLDHALKDCKKYHTDYVVMSAHLSCCAECNKLQGRVYSISGKSNIFPKLPDVIMKTGRVHPKCRHNISTYFFNNDGTDTIRDKNGHDVDAIKASQRPYIDDRSDSEKESYRNYLKEKENEYQKGIDEIEYYTIRATLPDIAPKSFGGYRRMKNQQTKNYLKIAKIAEGNGIKISEHIK